MKLGFLAFSILLSLNSYGNACMNSIQNIDDLDNCLVKMGQRPTSSTQEIQQKLQQFNIKKPVTIKVEKLEEIALKSCSAQPTTAEVGLKLSQEVEKILKIGTVQLDSWKVPGFPTTGAKDYSMKSSRGCDVNSLIKQMRADVSRTKPDLMNIYAMGLAVDTTDSQGQNIAKLRNSIDFIYQDLPSDAKIAFTVTSYGDKFRNGYRFEGTKGEVLAKVKRYLSGLRVYGGGDRPEFVYGGSYITSKNLNRAHGLVFNWTNAPTDNTKVTARNGQVKYNLRNLANFARRNVHVIRNVFIRCGPN